MISITPDNFPETEVSDKDVIVVVTNTIYSRKEAIANMQSTVGGDTFRHTVCHMYYFEPNSAPHVGLLAIKLVTIT